VVESSFDGLEYIVDLRFREQFAIPCPTDTFTSVLAAVPEEYVGEVPQIRSVVQVLCAEIAESFTAKGLALPPWRRAQSLLR
jgi:uncharacterized protein (TIGR01615 family)